MNGNSSRRIGIFGLKGIPLIRKGDDLAKIICTALKRQRLTFKDGDVVVVAHTIVSKAEGCSVRLRRIKPCVKAMIVAEQTGKPSEVVELMLREAQALIRLRGPHLITQTNHGFICANSAVDVSNISGGDAVATLPKDSDTSARRIQAGIKRLTGRRVAVIISDTFGRPFRMGQVNVAIGVAGIKPLLDRRGERDLYGYVLQVKEIAVADELASAAELVIGEADEGVPVAVIRGYHYKPDDKGSITQLIRPAKYDLFI